MTNGLESSIVRNEVAEPMYRNITTSIQRVLQAEPTNLRRNPYYYQIYYVYLNTIFASLLPLALLLFFNINTAKELFKMSRLETRSLATRASSVTLNQHRRKSTDLVELNPNVGTALQIAANAHGLEHENPLLSQQEAEKVPVITLQSAEQQQNVGLQQIAPQENGVRTHYILLC